MNLRRSGVLAQPLLAITAALSARFAAQAMEEWRQSGLYRVFLRGPATAGIAASPRDFRPAAPDLARAILMGRMPLAGDTLEMGQGGDPWDTASPTRAFAVQLHRFAWLPGLIWTPDLRLRPRAIEEALRLSLDWLALFSQVSPFTWSAETLERRVYNLACAVPELAAIASEDEQRRLLGALAQQGRHLLNLDRDRIRAAERAVAAAVAGAALGGRAGASLLARALPRAVRQVATAVLPDGGLRTRSPEQAMELLLDLLTLDDTLHQRGAPTPDDILRAIDRLSGAVRFLTLGDGRLGAFQGGASASAARVAAAVAHEDPSSHPLDQASRAGYHRLASPQIQILVDASPPASGAWSVSACAQPLALELTCDGDRMFVNAAWSPDAQGPQAFRLTDAASTASLGDGSAGAPLSGMLAAGLGARLVGGAGRVEARRDENETGLWLELSHDGWSRTHGLIHERRLFLDLRSSELRGEDRFVPVTRAPPRRKIEAFTVHFHLYPDVQASLARDRRSVLLRGPSNTGWWFRNDAAETAIAPSVYFDEGLPQRAQQITLQGSIGLEGRARVRWKLAPVEAADQPKGAR
jgi:uncharacterized heparinase superfamily protein